MAVSSGSVAGPALGLGSTESALNCKDATFAICVSIWQTPM